MPKYNTYTHENGKENLFLLDPMAFAGKPSREKMPSEQTRSDRVPRAGQKGGLNCFYYASQIVGDRDRVGKHDALKNTEQRKTELKFSRIRRGIATLDPFTRVANELLDYNDDYNRMPDNQIQSKISQLKNNTEHPKEEINAFKTFLEGFMKERRADPQLRLADYINKKLTILTVETYERALTHAGIDYSATCEKIKTSKRYPLTDINTPYEKPYQELSSEDKQIFLGFVYQEALLAEKKFYPLIGRYTDRPAREDLFDRLRDDLKERGPILAGGKFGKGFYTGNAQEMKIKLGTEQNLTKTLSINYWSSNQRTDKDAAHAVVIIGWHKTDRAKLLYFIDPSSPSQPGELPKVYAMSYNTFTEHLQYANTLEAERHNGALGCLYAAPEDSDDEIKDSRLSFRY